MISVVIPLYNKRDTILQTLSCVFKQSIQEFEVIIIDDGSTDGSVELVKSLDDTRLVVFSQMNKGVSAARNKGIELSKFEYIAFLDADDEWDVDYLETIKKLIDKFPIAGIYSTAYLFKYNDGTVKKPVFNKLEGHEDGEIIDDYCFSSSKGSPPIWTSATCINKKVVAEVGGFPIGIKRGEDLDFWLRIACKFDAVFIMKFKAYYMTESGNNANRSFSNINESFPYDEWRNYKYLPKRSLISYSNRMIFNIGIKALKAKKYFQFIRCLFNLRFY